LDFLVRKQHVQCIVHAIPVTVRIEIYLYSKCKPC
jgi:hypothetical protein